jgi:hypothetical protein
MAKKNDEQKIERYPKALLEEKYQHENPGIPYEDWKEKHGYIEDGIEYPENKRLKVMKERANELYKDMTHAIKDGEDAGLRFHKYSKAYAECLKEIEIEAQMPNFGER